MSEPEDNIVEFRRGSERWEAGEKGWTQTSGEPDAAPPEVDPEAARANVTPAHDDGVTERGQ